MGRLCVNGGAAQVVSPVLSGPRWVEAVLGSRAGRPCSRQQWVEPCESAFGGSRGGY